MVVQFYLGSNTVEFVVHSEPEVTTPEYTTPAQEYPRQVPTPDNNSSRDKLRFHTKCGPLVKLSNNQRTAERYKRNIRNKYEINCKS